MFLDNDFLLTTDISKKLYHDYSKNMPIIDYHCHLNPKEIYEDQCFSNLTEAWLTEGNNFGDHYKWRLMRTNGVSEELITGDADPYEKFLAFAKTMEVAYGNPIFEWCHLELRRFFGVYEILSTETAPKIWKEVNAKLQSEKFSRNNLIRAMKVKALSTTDDPIDDLKYHQLLKVKEKSNGFRVIPGFRPDKVINIQLGTYYEYLIQLERVSEVDIIDYATLEKAIYVRMAYFNENGCNICDHGIDSFDYVASNQNELDEIIKKARQKETLSEKEINQYKSAILLSLMKGYHEYDWTMQYHLHALRNLNDERFSIMGADTGFDAINSGNGARQIANLLSKGYAGKYLPRTILYSLNPNDWMQLLTIMGCFQGEIKQRIQFGTAWWFNDTYTGMRQQLEMLMEQSLLGNFIGMLTDSRSFLSYPRHEYFRRVLCGLIGEMVERGQIPEDEIRLGNLVKNISFNNANEYFKFLD